MATAWDVPTVGWTVIVMGWLLSPIFASLAPKIVSYLCFDADQKLRDLELAIIPELQETMQAVDKKRMLGRGDEKRMKGDVAKLDKMAAMLRHAREDSEDIFDDAQEKIVVADILNGWCMGVARIVQRGFLWLFFPIRLVDLETLEADLRKISLEVLKQPLLRNWAPGMSPVDKLMTVPKTLRSGMLKTILELRRRRRLQDIPRGNLLRGIYILLSGGGLLSLGQPAQEEAEDIVGKMVEWLRRAEEEDKMVRSGSSPLLQWMRRSSSSRWFLQRSEGALPVRRPSDSSGWWLSCWCSSVEFFKKCCCSIFYWLVHAIEVARSCRDESYNKFGITGYQENASMLDLLPTAISRRNLKKRIEKVESTVNEVKGSPLLSVATKSKPNDIANKNTCQVRTDSIKPNDIANKNRCQVRADSNRKVFGREKLRDDIMAKLRKVPHDDAAGSSTSPCYSVIGIYGVAGSGKTTFAGYIRDYINEECKEDRLFDTIMCIHVSETFSVDDIFHKMLKDIAKDRHSNISDREELEEKLKEALRGKRFFLILDDLWVKNKHDSQLEELISPLIVGAKGSKILVTARTKDAAGALCANELIKMPDLDEDQYLKMFMHYALDGTSFVHEEFEQVGREIAKKLHRSPIAAVAVAGRLGLNPNISFWKNVAKLDMLNVTRGALWWSYQQLNPDIRRCFEFCNIIPRRFKLEKVKLVHLWVAQGLVKTSCATEEMEDVAEGYIQELVSCSFLQPEGTSWSDDDCFTIHDLLHDLVHKIVGTDCFRIENKRGHRREGWTGDVPRDVRHLFVEKYNAELITKKIPGLKNLRTLIIFYGENDTQVEEKVIEGICMRLPKLRVLAIGFDQTCEFSAPNDKLLVPESIIQLKHLRYLAFRTSYKCNVILPSTLAKLLHLQLVDFGRCKISGFNFADLINLRHIFCRCESFPHIGRLSSLQTIPTTFIVKNEEGCEMKQLRDLNKLCGRLDIAGLGNVKSKEEALEANLAAKERLTELRLSFSSHIERRTAEVAAEVLEGLCPSVGLESLYIWHYRGSRYPDWMVGKLYGGPKDLQTLEFEDCGQVGGPGPELEAFPHLRILRLWQCSWDALPGNMEHLTSLQTLVITGCENIRSLPTLPESLKEFSLTSCNDELMKGCQTKGDPNWFKIKHIPKKYFNPTLRKEERKKVRWVRLHRKVKLGRACVASRKVGCNLGS